LRKPTVLPHPSTDRLHTSADRGRRRLGDSAPVATTKRDQELSLLSTLTTFETATDITLAGLAIEAFYPADDRTAMALLGDTDV
jgi:hypothetical protein